MPRSIWLGRRRVSVTTYEYDGEGRLARAVTRHDPEWLDDDRDWALADYHDQLSRCDKCGLPTDETTGEHNAGRWEAPPPRQCHACEAVHRRQAEMAAWEAETGRREPGLLYSVRAREIT
ncbi:hypothetical protein ACIBG7_15240 [Nonomuraea sp. NPDC050328]|uniref:hypothetical protein n=1 Tax=Nonomuraea sp. NPDC050328 TaxID=3364361 RepID=UPI0037B38B53